MTRSLVGYLLLAFSALYAFGTTWNPRSSEESSVGTEIFSMTSSIVKKPWHAVQKVLASSTSVPSPKILSSSIALRKDEIPSLNLREKPSKLPVVKKIATENLQLPAWMQGLFGTPAWEEGESAAIQEEIDRRVHRAGFSGSASKASNKASTEPDEGVAPGPFSYKIRAFYPGTGASGLPIAESGVVTEGILARVMGPPDYSVWSQEEQPGRLLSIGAHGILILEVEKGWIHDEPGADFAIFENPFPIAGSNAVIFAETAQVSVAEEDREDAYRTFPCDSTRAPFKGCAGVHPVIYHPDVPLDQIGGDLFDLADVGLSRARFIRIQDTGDQASLFPGKEGFDLDAIALLHTEKP